MKLAAALLLAAIAYSASAAESFGDTALAKNQLWLSPVKQGDSVVSRIYAKRTAFVDELDIRYCAEHNADEAKRRKCIENSRSNTEFPFFIDMHGDEKYSIGLNGREFKLSRISKKPGKPHYYIGSYAGEGISVVIHHPRLIGKIEYDPELGVLDANYRVLVTVKKGTLKKTFKGVLWHGR